MNIDFLEGFVAFFFAFCGIKCRSTLVTLSMISVLRRLLSLLVVLVLAVLGVLVFRQIQAGGPILEVFRDQDQEEEPSVTYQKEDYTLTDKPPLDLKDVEILSRLNDEYARLIQAVTPSVVSIYTPGLKRETLRDMFGREYEGEVKQTSGVGSGVIVSAQGHVITNHHVVSGKRHFMVTLNNGESYSAKLIGTDPALDVAVLRIDREKTDEKPPFQALKFGDSDRAQVGQMVFAVGNAFGLGEAVTAGHISAKERSITDTQRDLFQTDTAINPGNSGGPLVNLKGEIIGINVAIYSPDRQNKGFHGVGFSIPSNDARESFISIVERGRPIRGYLGVVVLDMIPQIRQILNYHGRGGAAVDAVTGGSPAELAGLRARDVIVDFNGNVVRGREHLLSLIQRAKVGTEVTMQVWRSGEKKELKTFVSELDAEAMEQTIARTTSDQDIVKMVGVTKIVEGSLSQKAGLKVNDVILGVNGVQVNSLNDMYARTVASAASQQTTFTIARGGQAALVSIPPVK